MSDFYTIQGSWTGEVYLVVAHAYKLVVYPPRSFTLPWTGDSGHHYGLSYDPRAGRRFGGPHWLAHLRACMHIEFREGQRRQADCAAARARRFAERMAERIDRRQGGEA